MKINIKLLGFLFVFGSSLAPPKNLGYNNAQDNSMQYEYLGQRISDQDSIVFLTIIRCLIGNQIFGLQLVDSGENVTSIRDAKLRDSDIDNDSDSEEYDDNKTIVARASVPNMLLGISSDNNSALSIIHMNRNDNQASLARAVARASVPNILPSVFIEENFSIQEIAQLKLTDREIIASMDKMWDKIIRSEQDNKNYIKSCIRIVRRTWKVADSMQDQLYFAEHPINLTMDQIVECLRILYFWDYRQDAIDCLEKVLPESLQSALEIFGKLNRFVSEVPKEISSDRISIDMWQENLNQFYEMNSQDIVNIARIIFKYFQALGCHGLFIVKKFECANKFYELFSNREGRFLHNLRDLKQVVKIKFIIGAIEERDSYASKIVTWFYAEDGSLLRGDERCIEYFAKLGISDIDCKMFGSEEGAEYERYTLRADGKYCNVSIERILSVYKVDIIKKKNDPVPKVMYVPFS